MTADQQQVHRLKQLLFDEETRELGDIARRLDAVYDRAGTETRFRTSVAAVIDGALRDAEVERHRELAEAIAPLVVRTVRTEIHGSQDLLVEALYPKTGELVRKFVASAMRDLVNDLNRRLDSSLPINRWLLKARSIFTGRSMAELAIAGAHAFEVEDLYLVRRGSGELIQHWARPGAAPVEADDAVFSSVLAAITGFADQALHADEGALRTLEIGERVLYVRASPAHLLAARCRSSAPPSIEQILDKELLHTLGAKREMEARSLGADGQQQAGEASLLADLAGRLEASVRAKQAGLAASGPSPVKVLATIVLLPLLALLLWQGWIGFQTWSVRRAAEAALAETTEVGGYPIRIDVARGGGSMVVTGLTPSDASRTKLAARLRDAAPDVLLVDQLVSLPEPPLAADLSPQIAAVKGAIGALRDDVRGGLGDLKGDLGALEARLRRQTAGEAAQHAEARLAVIARELARLAAAEGNQAKGFAHEAQGLVNSALKELGGLRGRVPAEPEMLAALNAAVARLRTALARSREPAGKSPPAADAALAKTLPEAARALQDATDEVAAAVARAGALASLAPLEARIAALAPLEARIAALDGEVARLRALPKPAPDAREMFERYARANAVFFGNGTDYRNEAVAAAFVEQAAAAILAYGGLVRVVGYTDERGNNAANQQLALSRAQRIVEALVAKGVPRARLVAIARVLGHEISPETGPTSPNRRVALEAGYQGEVP